MNKFLVMVLGSTGLVSLNLVSVSATGQETKSFKTVVRPGSVDLEKEYDLSKLAISVEQIHRLLPKDAIPALTDPPREKIGASQWLQPESRIIVVESDEEVLGVPLQILDQHEIVNTTVGKTAVAITYCPLCDSATVFSRKVKDKEGKESLLEFGVSGALFNSNVLMFDRTSRGLWSQLAMKALSGPWVGTHLQMLPVKLETYRDFAAKYPTAELISRDTGHERNYSRSVYGNYFASDNLMVPVFQYGDKLPRKTLGVGIATDDHAWFVPASEIGKSRDIETPAGVVSLAHNEAGIQVTSLPTGVRVAQTFYYSWSAFYPETTIIRE